MQITKVEPTYTGGGIYDFMGCIDDGTFFLANDAYFDVRLINTNPFDATYDLTGQVEWQESHLIRDMHEPESKEFFKRILEWVIKNKPDGNYQVDDMRRILNRLKEVM